jgi:hypothetical protein
MATLSECHKTLTNGVGKCSVPQFWGWGGEAGFCDAPAYGEQHPLEPWQRDLRAYAPGLACPAHGGPKAKCPIGCEGIDLGDGNYSGCACVGERCDCPNHPALIQRGGGK